MAEEGRAVWTAVSTEDPLFYGHHPMMEKLCRRNAERLNVIFDSVAWPGARSEPWRLLGCGLGFIPRDLVAERDAKGPRVVAGGGAPRGSQSARCRAARRPSFPIVRPSEGYKRVSVEHCWHASTAALPPNPRGLYNSLNRSFDLAIHAFDGASDFDPAAIAVRIKFAVWKSALPQALPAPCSVCSSAARTPRRPRCGSASWCARLRRGRGRRRARRGLG
jgi:hypothetical protein